MKIRNLMLMLAMAFSVALLTGCNFDGGVEQGRCVAFDANAKTLTIVVDVTHDQFNPHYSGGTHTFKLPEDSQDMGPAPTPGGRLPDGRSSSGVLIGAPAGTVVSAVADGTVVFSEWMTGYGLILIVDHGNGYMSLYAHNDTLLRDAGDRVRRGDAVARVGSSGGHGRPALYFELRRNGQPVDPSTWLQRQ